MSNFGGNETENGPTPLIARIWRGQTRTEDAAAYLHVLRATGVRDYQSTEGNRGVWILTRELEDRTEFTVMTLWTSSEAVRRFAGPDIERARYYPEDQRYLLAFPATVEHLVCPVAVGARADERGAQESAKDG